MSNLLPKIIATAAGVLSLGWAQLGAAPIVIPVFADAEIRGGASAGATVGDGATASIFVGPIDATRKTRSLLTFDLSSLPPNVTITSAKLVLDAKDDTSSAAAMKTINLHALTQTFMENTVTWNSRSAGNNWTTPGGDFSPTVLASASVSTKGGLNNTWESSALTTYVQTQYASQSVVSFILKGTDASEADTVRSLVAFMTSENLNMAYGAPRLLIEYSTSQVPEPSTTALLFGLGGLAVSFALRRPARTRVHGA